MSGGGLYVPQWQTDVSWEDSSQVHSALSHYNAFITVPGRGDENILQS
jgi:hypothetical protein